MLLICQPRCGKRVLLIIIAFLRSPTSLCTCMHSCERPCLHVQLLFQQARAQLLSCTALPPDIFCRMVDSFVTGYQRSSTMDSTGQLLVSPVICFASELSHPSLMDRHVDKLSTIVLYTQMQLLLGAISIQFAMHCLLSAQWAMSSASPSC